MLHVPSPRQLGGARLHAAYTPRSREWAFVIGSPISLSLSIHLTDELGELIERLKSEVSKHSSFAVEPLGLWEWARLRLQILVA